MGHCALPALCALLHCASGAISCFQKGSRCPTQAKPASKRPLRVAIVGAGPAGVYAADILTKSNEVKGGDFEVSIDLFEAYPAPYGLIRYGVAPDHPRIKGIVNALHKVLDRGDIRFLGNVTYGRDLTLHDFRAFYDAVIFSTGAIKDARAGHPRHRTGRLVRRRRLRLLVRRPPGCSPRMAAGRQGNRRHRQRQRGPRRRPDAGQARR